MRASTVRRWSTWAVLGAGILSAWAPANDSDAVDSVEELLRSYEAPAEPPPNAHPTLGGGWECDWGFQRAADVCEPISVPENASLNPIGNGWVCNWGYYLSGDGCQRVEVPANARPRLFGNGWTCARGFVREGDRCLPVTIPPNAQLDTLGRGCVCKPGFIRLGNACFSFAADPQLPTYRAPTMPPVWLGTGEGREYDVSGTSDSGDYVSGTVEKSGDGEVEGYLELEDGRTVYFEGEWDGPGEIEDYDEDGNHYDLEVDWRVALNAILRAAEATLAAPRWIL